MKFKDMQQRHDDAVPNDYFESDAERELQRFKDFEEALPGGIGGVEDLLKIARQTCRMGLGEPCARGLEDKYGDLLKALYDLVKERRVVQENWTYSSGAVHADGRGYRECADKIETLLPKEGAAPCITSPPEKQGCGDTGTCKQCATCRYFDKGTPGAECRRHAPQRSLSDEGDDTYWPIVTGEDWCGDYELKEEEA